MAVVLGSVLHISSVYVLFFFGCNTALVSDCYGTPMLPGRFFLPVGMEV